MEFLFDLGPVVASLIVLLLFHFSLFFFLSSYLDNGGHQGQDLFAARCQEALRPKSHDRPNPHRYVFPFGLFWSFWSFFFLSNIEI